MLDDFIVENRDEIITRSRIQVALRSGPDVDHESHENGIPVFIDQLCVAIRRARSKDAINHDDIDESARLHGRDLRNAGLTVAQVVRGYGDVCQAITTLAMEKDAEISPEEFQTLNLCLDDAIAEAVTVFGHDHDRAVAAQGTERLGVLAHELRSVLNTAMLVYESIRTGRVAPAGSTGVVLGRSLARLRDLINRSLADVRLDSGIDRFGEIPVQAFLEEVEVDAAVQANTRDLHLHFSRVDADLLVEGDQQVLAATLANLLQNAFKFSRNGGHVRLTTVATASRVLFEVADECGGLPPGKAEELFLPFSQRGDDRSGVGLGLSICRKAAAASGGELRVRDVPGTGCVFTLDLPRKTTSAAS